MTFAELHLYQAVYRVFGSVDSPGSEDWTRRRASEIYKLVLHEIVDSEGWTDQGIPYSREQVIDVWLDLRKNTKNRLKCQVSLIHGSHCFYASRGLGACSAEVELDRIVPASRGGEYTLENCLIACAQHNGTRGDRSIEDYLASAMRFPDAAGQ
jgi:5-methylcytosine-specific restriction endonuclease McrA